MLLTYESSFTFISGLYSKIFILFVTYSPSRSLLIVPIIDIFFMSETNEAICVVDHGALINTIHQTNFIHHPTRCLAWREPKESNILHKIRGTRCVKQMAKNHTGLAKHRSFIKRVQNNPLPCRLISQQKNVNMIKQQVD